MNKQWNDEELENVNVIGMAGDEIEVDTDFEESDKLSKLSRDAYDFIKQGAFDEAKDLFYKTQGKVICQHQHKYAEKQDLLPGSVLSSISEAT